MARRSWMQRLARWHIWLGWIVGLPILMWTATGLFMVLRPIEEVRGNDRRIEHPARPISVSLDAGAAPTLLREGRLVEQRGRSVLIATFMDGTVQRIDLQAPGQRALPPVDETEARRAVAFAVRGGKAVRDARLFPADRAPLDFRKPMAAWQVTLADDTHVYVGRDTGEIEAIRTRWWRWFDFMWGLHILDPQDREDSSHPLLIVLAALSVVGSVMGCILLLRRRKALRA